MRDTSRAAHGDAVRLAQPVRFHALLCGHRVVAIEDAVAVQQRCGRQHGDVATCVYTWHIHEGCGFVWVDDAHLFCVFFYNYLRDFF